jgi:hypothetical protein
MTNRAIPNKVTNFNLYGYQIAKGTKGTGWMAFSDRDIPELVKKLKEAKAANPTNHYAVYEVLDDDVAGWFETQQFEYEVGKLMPKLTKDDIDSYLDAQTEYSMGYTRYIKERIKKVCPLEYRELFY